MQARVRFAGGHARKRWFNAHRWLTRRAEHPTRRRVEEYGLRSFGHQFRLTAAADIDAPFERLIRDAYLVGLQRHLDEKAGRA